MIEISERDLIESPSKNFIDDEFLSGFYYPELKLMHYKWKQPCIKNHYKEKFEKGLIYADSVLVHYFISDIRKQGMVGSEDRRWFEQVALPKAIDKGLKKAAVVFDGNVFKMYYVNLLMVSFYNKGINMKYFKDTPLAVNWLFNT